MGYVITDVATVGELVGHAVRLSSLGASRFLVQPQFNGDLKALLGVITEPGIGRFIVFGLGGVYAEALADVALVPGSASVSEITEALAATRLGSVLNSPRWPSPRTFDRMVEIIAAAANRAGQLDARCQPWT